MKKSLRAFLFFALASSASGGSFDQLRRGLELPPVPEPAPLAADAAALAGDTRYWVTVGADDKYDRTALLNAGLDIIETEKSYVSGLIEAAPLDQLAAKGFIVKSRRTIQDYARQHLKDFPANDAAYHNYTETTDLLRALAAENPAEASLFSLGKTIEGRDIWCLRLNSAEKGEGPSARPAALFMGNHHGREHLSNEVALALARHLLANKTDPEIRKFLDTLDIYIAPMTNPDGAEYDIASGKYRWHRKNTRVNADKSIGVDLNRNYDSLWCQAGASQYPAADTYCGPYAFSEPETQAVKRFVEARSNLKTLMSYHSYSSLLLYPWAGKDTPVESDRDRKVFEAMARGMTAFTGYRPQQSSDLYVATGDTTDWAYAARGIFAFTTELEGTTFYPGAATIDKASVKNVKAALYLLGVTADPYKLAR
ncbi:MAG: M14 family metallopeptidase [Elusimicrobiales bacterium]|nr:M14 family metallopeptidase [Elusimicrobiales bacterium]